VESTAVVIVLTTLPAGADADVFARTLVDRRVAACVSVSSPVRSTYRWNGDVQTEAERQVVIKTTADRVPDLQAAVTSLHPYSVPEWIVIAAADGSASYFDWIRQSVAP